jgi:hypothetical protein
MVILLLLLSGCWWTAADVPCEYDTDCPSGTACDATLTHPSGDFACASTPREAVGLPPVDDDDTVVDDDDDAVDDDDVVQDDDDVAVTGFDTFAGQARLHVTWTPAMIAQGRFNCEADYDIEGAVGSGSCPSCFVVWEVRNTARSGAAQCMGQSSILGFEVQFDDVAGASDDGGGVIGIWKNVPGSGVRQIGSEAPAGSIVSFDGEDDYEFSNSAAGLTFWYSGAVDFSLE